MNEYVVSLNINLSADSPEEAVKEMIKWLEEDGVRVWIYSVENIETGDEFTLDSFDLESKNGN